MSRFVPSGFVSSRGGDTIRNISLKLNLFELLSYCTISATAILGRFREHFPYVPHEVEVSQNDQRAPRYWYSGELIRLKAPLKASQAPAGKMVSLRVCTG